MARLEGAEYALNASWIGVMLRPFRSCTRQNTTVYSLHNTELLYQSPQYNCMFGKWSTLCEYVKMRRWLYLSMSPGLAPEVSMLSCMEPWLSFLVGSSPFLMSSKFSYLRAWTNCNKYINRSYRKNARITNWNVLPEMGAGSVQDLCLRVDMKTATIVINLVSRTAALVIYWNASKGEASCFLPHWSHYKPLHPSIPCFSICYLELIKSCTKFKAAIFILHSF